jgi:hypothetical protein
VSDVLAEQMGGTDDSTASTAAMLGSIRVVGETLERVGRLEGQCSLTWKHVDALSNGLLGVLMRFVPEEHHDGLLVELAAVVDAALGSPILRLPSLVKR